MTLDEAKAAIKPLVEGYKAHAKSAYLYHMDNGDLIGIERDEHVDMDTVKAISVFEQPT
jgi:hypothetical protein